MSQIKVQSFEASVALMDRQALGNIFLYFHKINRYFKASYWTIQSDSYVGLRYTKRKYKSRTLAKIHCIGQHSVAN